MKRNSLSPLRYAVSNAHYFRFRGTKSTSERAMPINFWYLSPTAAPHVLDPRIVVPSVLITPNTLPYKSRPGKRKAHQSVSNGQAEDRHWREYASAGRTAKRVCTEKSRVIKPRIIKSAQGKRDVKKADAELSHVIRTICDNAKAQGQADYIDGYMTICSTVRSHIGNSHRGKNKRNFMSFSEEYCFPGTCASCPPPVRPTCKPNQPPQKRVCRVNLWTGDRPSSPRPTPPRPNPRPRKRKASTPQLQAIRKAAVDTDPHWESIVRNAGYPLPECTTPSPVQEKYQVTNLSDSSEDWRKALQKLWNDKVFVPFSIHVREHQHADSASQNDLIQRVRTWLASSAQPTNTTSVSSPVIPPQDENHSSQPVEQIAPSLPSSSPIAPDDATVPAAEAKAVIPPTDETTLPPPPAATTSAAPEYLPVATIDTTSPHRDPTPPSYSPLTTPASSPRIIPADKNGIDDQVAGSPTLPSAPQMLAPPLPSLFATDDSKHQMQDAESLRILPPPPSMPSPTSPTIPASKIDGNISDIDSENPISPPTGLSPSTNLPFPATNVSDDGKDAEFEKPLWLPTSTKLVATPAMLGGDDSDDDSDAGSEKSVTSDAEARDSGYGNSPLNVDDLEDSLAEASGGWYEDVRPGNVEVMKAQGQAARDQRETEEEMGNAELHESEEDEDYVDFHDDNDRVDLF